MQFTCKTIAITGGMGSGKSAFSGILRSFGYAVIDADLLARRVASRTETLQDIQDAWGSAVIAPDGSLDRALLRNLMVTDETVLNWVNDYFHPRIAREFHALKLVLSEQFPGVWIFYEAALIFETAQERQFDAVVLVMAQEKLRFERLMSGRGIDLKAATALMQKQWTDSQKRALVQKPQLVVENSGSLADLEAEALRLVQFLRQDF